MWRDSGYDSDLWRRRRPREYARKSTRHLNSYARSRAFFKLVQRFRSRNAGDTRHYDSKADKPYSKTSVSVDPRGSLHEERHDAAVNVRTGGDDGPEEHTVGSGPVGEAPKSEVPTGSDPLSSDDHNRKSRQSGDHVPSTYREYVRERGLQTEQVRHGGTGQFGGNKGQLPTNLHTKKTDEEAQTFINRAYQADDDDELTIWIRPKEKPVGPATSTAVRQRLVEVKRNRIDPVKNVMELNKKGPTQSTPDANYFKKFGIFGFAEQLNQSIAETFHLLYNNWYWITNKEGHKKIAENVIETKWKSKYITMNNTEFAYFQKLSDAQKDDLYSYPSNEWNQFLAAESKRQQEMGPLEKPSFTERRERETRVRAEAEQSRRVQAEQDRRVKAKAEFEKKWGTAEKLRTAKDPRLPHNSAPSWRPTTMGL